jgi:pimeloyl-ACP methyl ester carboxylesterase
MQVHWNFRRLARLLCEAGFHVLRFDYYATGDSAGPSSEGTLEQWRQDIRSAVSEVADLSGVSRLSAVGFRLGAAILMDVDVRLRSLVLWEPVVDGPDYVASLRVMHEELFSYCVHPPRLPRNGLLLELAGHPFPPALQRGIESVRLRPPFACSAERAGIAVSREIAASHELSRQLQEQGMDACLLLPPSGDAEDSPFLQSSRAPQRIASFVAAAR